MNKKTVSRKLAIMLVMVFTFTWLSPNVISYSKENTSELPEGFTSAVIGEGDSGKVIFNEEEQQFTIEGTGEYIGKDKGVYDNYELVSYEIEGDGTIVARIADFDMVNANYGQAGVIIRSDDTTVDADYFAVYVEPSKNQYRYAYRDNSVEKTGAAAISALDASNKEMYIKLTKNGSSFNYYISTDVNFNNIIAKGGQTINSESLSWNLGFVVSNGGSATPAIAKFDNITISDKDGIKYPSTNNDEEIEDDKDDNVVDDKDDSETDDKDNTEIIEAFLPRVFSNIAIGNEKEESFVNYNKENGIFTINGSGNQIGKDKNTTDSYQFINCQVEGDATIIARLVDFNMSEAANGQAGLIVRSDNTTNNADYFAVYVEPNKDQYRYAYRDNASSKTGAAAITGLSAADKELYIKIVKEGNVFRYYISEDITFAKENTYTNSQKINNDDNTWYVGFVVSNGESKNDAIAQFDNVTIETSNKVYFDSLVEEKPLDAVENLSAVAGDKIVELTWDEVEDASEYIVKRSLSKNGTYEEIVNINDNYYIDESVDNYVTYYYKVVAVNDEGYSNDSKIVKALPNNSNEDNILYEDEAALFTMVEEPNDTIFDSIVSFEGYVDNDGVISVLQDGAVVIDEFDANSNENFKFNLTLNLGRNEIEIVHCNGDGGKSIKKYNLLYLTDAFYNIIVDGNYDGDINVDISGKKIFTTIEEAINTISKKNTERVVILVKNGRYKEKLTIESPYITLIGEDSNDTIITYDAAHGTINPDTGVKYGTSKSASVIVKSKAVGFAAENLTFENSFVEKGEESEQAVAMNNESDESIFVNCRFIANQDTLLANASSQSPARQYYYKCYIQGDVDFIFGRAQAVFNDCELASYNRRTAPYNGYITAANTWDADNYGYLIINSRLTGLNGIDDKSVALGRPWRPSSATEKITPSVVYVNCYMGSHITNAGWDDMGEGSLAIDSRFFEYGSFGPGAVLSDTRNLLTLSEAENYTMEAVFASNSAGKAYATDWNPLDSEEENSINILFNNIVRATALEVDNETINLTVDESTNISVNVLPADSSNRTLLFESSDNSIAIVDENGVVTAKSEGNAIVTIRTGNVYTKVKVIVLGKVLEEEQDPEDGTVDDDINNPDNDNSDLEGGIDKPVIDKPQIDNGGNPSDDKLESEVEEEIKEDIIDSNNKEDNSLIYEEDSKEQLNDDKEIPVTGGTSAIVLLIIASAAIILGLILRKRKK